MSKWSLPLNVWAHGATEDLVYTARESTVLLFQAVANNAVVDKGRFRANLNVSYGVPDEAVTYSTNQARADEEIQKVWQLPVGGLVFITNALPYAAVLEYGGYPNPPKRGSKKRGETEYTIHVSGGYSLQAPHGIFRLAAVQYSDFVKKAAKG